MFFFFFLTAFCLFSDVILNSTEQTYLAKNLTGGSKYYVYIQAESPAGRGVLSEPVVGVPDVSGKFI